MEVAPKIIFSHDPDHEKGKIPSGLGVPFFPALPDPHPCLGFFLFFFFFFLKPLSSLGLVLSSNWGCKVGDEESLLLHDFPSFSQSPGTGRNGLLSLVLPAWNSLKYIP